MGSRIVSIQTERNSISLSGQTHCEASKCHHFSPLFLGVVARLQPSPNSVVKLIPSSHLSLLRLPVPAFSFVVNTSQAFTPADRLALDHRLVVAFPPQGAVIADLSMRRDNVVAWYRGMGQINRIQGVWQPDWVGIDFLVYGSGPVGFSVLWDEQGEVIRHIIDFVRLPLA